MEKYVRIVQKLTSLNIKLVAVDFDQTIINMHTCGVWQFSSKSLVPRVRPSFKQFFKAALSCGDLHVAIVTKSPQISLIREVMEQALPECDTSRIHYRGADGEWKEVKGVSKEANSVSGSNVKLYMCRTNTCNAVTNKSRIADQKLL
ncbi:hypothetical protein pdam_00016191 [Pocillopora damicornis]|uniref:FCP1 homology domain-containing protein n=1 Tax=Pocillopora damicornis TaxID=46731 RepID=A0A3M6TCV6_POCDA|nr:hypothetical protein pdam_00016191 [Pocillopora damicornis]